MNHIPYLKLDQEKIEQVVRLSNCSITFKNTGSPDFVRGYLVDNSTGASIGRATIECSCYSHIKWYGSAHHQQLDTDLYEWSKHIKEINETAHKVNISIDKIEAHNKKIEEQKEMESKKIGRYIFNKLRKFFGLK